jgi:hypothetical protein
LVKSTLVESTLFGELKQIGFATSAGLRATHAFGRDGNAASIES